MPLSWHNHFITSYSPLLPNSGENYDVAHISASTKLQKLQFIRHVITAAESTAQIYTYTQVHALARLATRAKIPA